MPVRTNNGLVFPLRGTTLCPAPEVALALTLGAKITVRHGIVVPTDKKVPIFGPFIRECLEHRKKAGPKTLRGLFWKEISNSTYGKTAQGLREKRVYDMRERMTKVLPESRITNPFFAAFITSYVRALLGEVMNSLPETSMVFSCTTDGFITNATPDDIAEAQNGQLSKLFAKARNDLTGDPAVLETKHEVRQPLGWRTRGQATLKPATYEDKGADFNYVLAKGGIFTPKNMDSAADKNDYILGLFFDRTPDQIITAEGFTGIRDIVEWDADLVEKLITKRLNMEFDWKRRPLSVSESPSRQHLLFSTQPWRTVDQFRAIRTAWEDYVRQERACLKSKKDFERFALFVEVQAALPKEVTRYLPRVDPDIKRLRQMLCCAWQHGEAGFKAHDRSASAFSELLYQLGIPCKKTDVENAKKRIFVAHLCPPTQIVRDALARLKTFFPKLQTAKFIYLDTTETGVSIRPTAKRCEFVARCLEETPELARAA